MHRNRILVFSAATFLYWAALFIYVPTLPAFVKERASSLAAVGVVLSMFGLWEAILRTPLGILVDATRRQKPWLLAGFLAGGAGALDHGTRRIHRRADVRAGRSRGRPAPYGRR